MARTPETLTTQAAAEVLRWWIEAGVDLALDETSHDRFAQPPPKAADPRHRSSEASVVSPRESVPAPVRSPISAAAPTAPDEAARNAREMALAAQSLDELRAALDSFNGCGLKATATQLVFCDGAPGAPLMLVGEAPGGDEDRIGRPFVGRAGQLLDRMLAAIGLDRTGVYIANVVPWRPPGNRAPTLQETAACLPFIRRQIELADPRLLVCLGNSSAQTLLGLKDGITRTRGQLFDYPVSEDRSIKAMPMFHPAYLLRQPTQKRLAWRDLQKLQGLLEKGPA
jgi:uracil-DNA glycosylase